MLDFNLANKIWNNKDELFDCGIFLFCLIAWFVIFIIIDVVHVFVSNKLLQRISLWNVNFLS